MCIAAEKLPRRCRTAMVYKNKLTRRCRDATANKKILARRCHDGFKKNVSNFTVATVLDQRYWY